MTFMWRHSNSSSFRGPTLQMKVMDNGRNPAPTLVAIIFLLVVATVHWRPSEGLNINIGVLLPNTPPDILQEPCFSVAGLRGVLVDTMRKLSALYGPSAPGPNLQFRVVLEDSQCSDIYGPLRATKLWYLPQKIHMFYGPCCKYALAPVARFSSVAWNLPVISPGGLTPAFGEKSFEFSLLTRIMSPYKRLAHVLLTMLAAHDFRTVTMLFHENLEHRILGRSDCYYVVDAVHVLKLHQAKIIGVKNISEYTIHSLKFDSYSRKNYDFTDKLEEIKNQSRGRSLRLRHMTRLKSPTTRLLVQQIFFRLQTKRTSKLRITCPLCKCCEGNRPSRKDHLCGESWIPNTKGQSCKKSSHHFSVSS